MKKMFRLLLFLGFLFSTVLESKVFVGLVIDQGSGLLFKKVMPFLSQGLYRMHKKGLSFEKAYFPHASPNTSAGHAGLSTGAYPDTHGIIDNKYLDSEGVLKEADEDNREESYVFRPDGSLYEYGKSSIQLKADTILDQVMLDSEPIKPCTAVAFSVKSRAAIMLAGHQGKAFWLDLKTGKLTTSKAYEKRLPDWVTSFNDQYGLHEQSVYEWVPFLNEKNEAYKKWEIHNYKHSPINSLFKKRIEPDKEDKDPYEVFTKTPWGDQWLLNAALAYLEQALAEDKDQNIIVWISLSGIDKAGHMFGPSSMELVDMMYHLDGDLLQFFDSLYQLVPEEQVLSMLTADHGVFEIPEVLQDKGFRMPKRILVTDVIQSINNLVKKTHNVDDLIKKFDAPQFYFDVKVYDKLSEKKKQKVCSTVLDFLKKMPGIRHAWTPEQLLAKSCSKEVIPYRFKRQLYPGRIGHVIACVEPYIMLTTYPKGTSHTTPYWYDIHVPLIWYQKDRWNGKKITEPVSTLRVAATIANEFGVEAPSAAEKELLPGF